MNILVVAAHPDDEVLGCGGVMARHAAAGDKVHVLFLADGVTARESSGSDAVAQRQQQALAAAQQLGAAEPTFAGFPDNRMDTVALLDIVQVVETEIARVQPTTIYCHYGGDLNVDHRIAHQATITACRPLPAAVVNSVYAFETLSSTEWSGSEAQFSPDRFVDVDTYVDKKIAALACYRDELRPFPHPRSTEAVTALGQLRGAASGLAFAEAFKVIRQVVAENNRR